MVLDQTAHVMEDPETVVVGAGDVLDGQAAAEFGGQADRVLEVPRDVLGVQARIT